MTVLVRADDLAKEPLIGEFSPARPAVQWDGSRLYWCAKTSSQDVPRHQALLSQIWEYSNEHSMQPHLARNSRGVEFEMSWPRCIYCSAEWTGQGLIAG